MGIILSKGDYYGEIQSETDSGGILLSEYDYTAERTDWHYHENPYFMFLIHGNLYDRNKQQETLCTGGDLVFHNWQETHWNEKHSKAARGFHIEFEKSWFKNHALNIELWEGSKSIQDPRVHHIMARIYSEFRSQDSFSELSIELLFIELCEGIVQREIAIPKVAPKWISLLKQMVQEDDLPLDLKSLSAILGVHPVHISRAMPRYLANTLGDYIRDQRVKKSISYLIDTHQELSLTQIAYICGFSDQSHYIRTFKSRMGSTPGSYLRALKN